MQLVIIGAGAMGSLFGGLLASVASVTLLDPWQQHIDEIRRNGLQLTGLSGDRRAAVFATSDPADLSPAGLIIVLVKSHQTEWAAEMAASLLTQDGLAVTLQNGLGNGAVLESKLGRHRTCIGVTTQGATVVGPGHVHHAGQGPTVLGLRPENEQRVRAAAELLSRGGLEVRVSKDIDTLVWGKLVANAGINALTALLRVPNGALVRAEPLRALMDQAVAEAASVAAAKGIPLPYADPLSHVHAVAVATGKNRSSMLQDTLRGVPTEIEVINGAIVREAKAVGVATPVTSMLLALVQGMEATYAERV
jgi:2-dehydropantoate 2-reductase